MVKCNYCRYDEYAHYPDDRFYCIPRDEGCEIRDMNAKISPDKLVCKLAQYLDKYQLDNENRKQKED